VELVSRRGAGVVEQLGLKQKRIRGWGKRSWAGGESTVVKAPGKERGRTGRAMPEGEWP